MAKQSNRPEMGKKEWETLQAMRRKLHDVLPTIDKSEACGIDCQEWRAIHREASEFAESVAKHFFPNGEPK